MILSVMYTGGSTLVSTVLRKSVRFFIINYFSIIIKTLSKLKFREFFGPALLQMLYNMDIEMSSLRNIRFSSLFAAGDVSRRGGRVKKSLHRAPAFFKRKFSVSVFSNDIAFIPLL